MEILHRTPIYEIDKNGLLEIVVTPEKVGGLRPLSFWPSFVLQKVGHAFPWNSVAIVHNGRSKTKREKKRLQESGFLFFYVTSMFSPGKKKLT